MTPLPGAVADVEQDPVPKETLAQRAARLVREEDSTKAAATSTPTESLSERAERLMREDAAPGPYAAETAKLFRSAPPVAPSTPMAAVAEQTRVGAAPANPASRRLTGIGKFASDVFQAGASQLENPAAAIAQTATVPFTAARTLARSSAEQDASNAVEQAGGNASDVTRTVSPKEAAISTAQLAALTAGPTAEGALGRTLAPAIGSRAAAIVARTGVGAAAGATFTPEQPGVGAFVGGALGAAHATADGARAPGRRPFRTDADVNLSNVPDRLIGTRTQPPPAPTVTATIDPSAVPPEPNTPPFDVQQNTVDQALTGIGKRRPAAPAAPVEQPRAVEQTPAELPKPVESPAREPSPAEAAPRPLVPESSGLHVTEPEMLTRNIARGLKSAHPDAIAHAAPEMAQRVPENAVLVPLPDHTGSTEANAQLASAIAQHADADVADVIGRKSQTASSDALREKGKPGVTADEHEASMTKTGELPAGRPVVFIDNVETTGATAEGARRVLGVPDAKLVAFAKAPIPTGESAATSTRAPATEKETAKDETPTASKQEPKTEEAKAGGSQNATGSDAVETLTGVASKNRSTGKVVSQDGFEGGHSALPEVPYAFEARQKGWEDGFITSTGRFVNRKEGLDVARKRDQLRRAGTPRMRGGGTYEGFGERAELEAGDVVAPSSASSDVAKDETASESLSQRAERLTKPDVAKPSVAPREFPIAKGAHGHDTTVALSDDRELKAKYAVVEAPHLIASHDATSFSERPEYPAGVQGRAYHGTRGRAAREAVEGATAKMSASRMLDAGSSVDGPPVVTKDGYAIIGNQRTMMLQRSKELAPERYAEYRAELTKRAARFGVTPESIDAMQHPALVRVLDDPSVDARDAKQLGDINRTSDIAASKAKDPTSEGASRASALKASPEAMQQFASTIGADDTIADYLNDPAGAAFVRGLVKHGVVGQQEIGRFIDARTGRVTKDGAEIVRNMLYSAAVPDADALDRAPKNIKAKIEHAIPAIVQANLIKHYGLSQALNAALDLLHSARANSLPLETHLAQGDLVGTAPHERAVLLARFLESQSKAAVADAFRQYAARAKEARDMAESHDMFGHTPPTRPQLLRDLFAPGARVGEPPATYHDDTLVKYDTPEIRAAVAHAAALPRTIHDTSPARQQFRTREAVKMAEGATKFDGVAHFFLGLPGAGKSTLIDPLVASDGAALLDADVPKSHAAEWSHGIGADALHDESVLIRTMAMDLVTDKRGNIAFPTVGDPVKTPETIRYLQQLGYTVHIHYSDVPNELAADRMLSGWRAGSRHLVDPLRILERGDGPRRGFAAASDIPGVITHDPIDNAGPKDAARPIPDWRKRWGLDGEGATGADASEPGSGSGRTGLAERDAQGEGGAEGRSPGRDSDDLDTPATPAASDQTALRERQRAYDRKQLDLFNRVQRDPASAEAKALARDESDKAYGSPAVLTRAKKALSPFVEQLARAGIEHAPARRSFVGQHKEPPSHVNLTGADVSTPERLRAALTVMRHPLSESVSVLFKDAHGTVADHFVYSSGALATVQFDMKRFIADIAERAHAIGVPAVVLAHNHPSGNPEPSSQDRMFNWGAAKFLKDNGVTLEGHMVIDHDSGTWMSAPADGEFTWGELGVTIPGVDTQEWKTSVQSGAPMATAESMAGIARDAASPDATTILYRGSNGRVVAAESRSLHEPIYRLLDHANRQRTNLAAYDIMIAAPSDRAETIREIAKIDRRLGKPRGHYVTDVLSVDPNGTEAPRVVSGVASGQHPAPDYQWRTADLARSTSNATRINGPAKPAIGGPSGPRADHASDRNVQHDGRPATILTPRGSDDAAVRESQPEPDGASTQTDTSDGTYDVFHGTHADFDQFDPAHIGTGQGPDASSNHGMFFTADASEAHGFARAAVARNGGTPRVIPTRIRLRNPATITDAHIDAAYNELESEIAQRARHDPEFDGWQARQDLKKADLSSSPSLARALQNEMRPWHDGAILQNKGEPDWYVVKSAGQVALRDAAAALHGTIGEQPDLYGSANGGASDDEYATGIKNAVSEAERARLGMGKRVPQEPRTQQQMYDAGKAVADADPTAIARMLTELRENPEKIIGSKEEAGLLLKHRVDLDNKLNELLAAKDAAVAAHDAPAERLARLQLAEHREAIKEFVQLAERTGTASGRALAARKMMSKLDYSLSHMETMAEAAKGSALTHAELARVKALHDELVVKLAAAEKDVTEARERAANAEADLHHAQLRAEAMQPLMNRVSAKLGTAADGARARIRARGLRAMAGMDPEELADHAIVGAAELANGIVRFADWSRAMTQSMGESITPHLREIFDASNKELNKELKAAREVEAKEAAKQAAKQAKPAIGNPGTYAPGKRQPADIRAKLKTRLDDGASISELRPYLRQLALEHIRSGITSREPLLDALYRDVLNTGASVTRAQTRDALSGYGDFKSLDKSADKAKLRDIQTESQKLAQLEALQHGEAPLATGFERQSPSDEARQLTKQVNDAKRAAGIKGTDDASRLKSALSAAKTRTKNAIADLRTEIDTGQRIVSGKHVLISDAELDTLRTELAELRKTEAEVFGKSGLTDEQRLKLATAAAQRTADQWEDRLANARKGTFAIGGPRSRMSTPELDALRAKADLARAEYAELKSLDPEQQRLEAEKRLPNAIKTAQRNMEMWESRVAAASAGKFPATGAKVQASTPELDALRTKAAEARAEYTRLKAEDPAQQQLADEAANVRYRTVLAKREAELLDRLAREDYTPKPLRPGTRFDRESMRRKAEVEEIKQRYQEKLRQFERSNRTVGEKVRAGGLAFVRAGALSWPTVILKLTSVALSRTITTPLTDLAALGVANALPKLAIGAPRHGTRSPRTALRAEAAAQVAMWTDGLADAGRLLRNKQSQLTLLHGKHKLPHEWFEYFGSIHAALKEPVKRAEYARALYRGTVEAMERGENTTDDFVKLRLSTEAYLHAERAVAMNDNVIVNAWNDGLRRLEQKDKVTGKANPLGVLFATALKTDMPVVKAPTNVILDASEFIAGLPLGAARAAWAYANGIEDLKPVERDSIIRMLSKGMVGMALMALYFYKHDRIEFGGFYQPGEKRAGTDVPAEGARIDGTTVSKTWLHNPLFMAGQFAATIARVAPTRLRKKDADPVGYGSALVAASVGLLDEMPLLGSLVSDTRHLSDPKERGDFLAKKAASIAVPGIVQWVASQTDTSTIPRKPVGLKQHLEYNLPGLRAEIPVDAKKARAAKIGQRRLSQAGGTK